MVRKDVIGVSKKAALPCRQTLENEIVFAVTTFQP